MQATSTEAQMRDNSILTLRLCQLDGSEEATDAGLCVFRPRPRSNSPPGERRVRWRGCGVGEQRVLFPPRNVLRGRYPTRYGAAFPDPCDP